MTETAADIIIARVTGEAWFGKNTSRRAYPTHLEVARHAYSLYEARGRVDGNDVQDWLLAERELQRGLR
jgi:hypothetical protein